MTTELDAVAAFDLADQLADTASRTADTLRSAAVSETDPDIAAELRARAAIAGLVGGLLDWADSEDGATMLWCLSVTGRLLSDPARLARLAPEVMGSIPVEPARAAAQV